MTLLQELADQTLAEHPLRAVSVLERLGEGEAIAVVESTSMECARTIVPCLSPAFATAVLEGVELERAGQILDGLSVDTLARLLRRVEIERQGALLERLQPRSSRAVGSLLRFPEHTAGALMDPEVLALPMELRASDALQRVREAAERARYNLYVLHQARLVGALNLRELLIAAGDTPLSDVMVRDPQCVLATADRATVLAHPGWRRVHALPVVDASDIYLGAIRYRALRSIEDELRSARFEETETSAAFAEVIAAGARGLLDALGGATPARGKGRS